MDHIAILMATYNGEKYIEEQIQSILHQTEDDYVCYIHDDGSTDMTLSLIERYEEDYPDKIHVLRYNRQGGAKNNFMSLLERVDAQYYMFCDQDDVWLSEKIEETYIKMQDIESTGIPCAVFSDLEVVDEELNIINQSFLSYMHKNPSKLSVRDLLVQNVAAGCSMMINKSLRDIACSYRNIDNIAMHDWWAILIAAAVGRLGFVKEPLILYRQHSDNQIGASHDIIRWIKEKTQNILHCRQITESRKRINQQTNIALELNQLNGLKAGDQILINELANIRYKKKLARIKLYWYYKLIPCSIKDIWKYVIV